MTTLVVHIAEAAAEAGEQVAIVDTEPRHDAMTLCIIDTAPHAAPDATRVARAVDGVVIPCRPTAFDRAAAGNAVDIIKAAGTPAVFVLSAGPFRAPETAESRPILSDYGLRVAPVTLTERRAFARAVATGRAVTEFEPDGKAAEEVRTLWPWLKEPLS